jgi:Coenzyme PQQ synthesis protein D (PqqD)
MIAQPQSSGPAIEGNSGRNVQSGDWALTKFEYRAVLPNNVLMRQLDGESVLLNLESERYFGLDGTGTRMLELITTMPNVGTAYEKLLEEFEVEPAILRAHLDELLRNLVENGLLNLLPADVGTTPTL